VGLILGLNAQTQFWRVRAKEPLHTYPCVHKLLFPLTFIGLPFDFGYHPCGSKPGDSYMINSLQVHIFCFCLVTMWLWAAEASSFYYTELDGPIIGDLTPATATVIHVILALVSFVMVCALEHICIILLALPPYIDESEGLLLLDVLRDYPNGMGGWETRAEAKAKSTKGVITVSPGQVKVGASSTASTTTP